MQTIQKVGGNCILRLECCWEWFKDFSQWFKIYASA